MKNIQNNLMILLSFIIFSSCQTIRQFRSSHPDEIKSLLAAYLPNHITTPEDPALFDKIWDIKSSYCATFSDPYWIIPSVDLPKDLYVQKSNNNVTIAVFNHRLYMAWRTGPTHFASKKTGMYIISTADGSHWRKEMEIFYGRDVREPYLLAMDGKLHFYCFAAGKSMTAFEPDFISRYYTTGDSIWHGPENVLTKGEVHWSIKKRNGKIFMTSYEGSHYELEGPSQVSLFFKESKDGESFYAVGDSERVYYGGVSETAFEFDREGNLWAVTRLEDGDESGFGSHVVFADKSNLGKWEFPKDADPKCFMSPKMFRQGDILYLIGRRQLGRKPFGKTKKQKSMKKQRLRNWVGYSLSPKTTALFRINKENRKVEWIMDLPGAGDTAFPSILRLDENRLLIANYSSPVRDKNRPWLFGQLGRTGIYLQVITFQECNTAGSQKKDIP